MALGAASFQGFGMASDYPYSGPESNHDREGHIFFLA
jgi:hypothetical protein